MAEPDELYTLRAQYWLGHYTLALDKAKNASCKPMPPHLKNEREELVLRCYLGLKQIRFDLRHQAVESPVLEQNRYLLKQSYWQKVWKSQPLVPFGSSVLHSFIIFRFTPR